MILENDAVNAREGTYEQHGSCREKGCQNASTTVEVSRAKERVYGKSDTHMIN